MTNKLLLPHSFKWVGLLILIPAAVMGVYLMSSGYEYPQLNSTVFAILDDSPLGKPEFFSFPEVNITNTLVGSLFIIGALMASFSKEKREDEFIANLRLSSLLWAVWVSYLLLLISFIFVYGTAFFTVMVYNMYTILIIFMIRFNYILYKNSKLASDEK